MWTVTWTNKQGARCTSKAWTEWQANMTATNVMQQGGTCVVVSTPVRFG